jgi:hypothetical protein
MFGFPICTGQVSNPAKDDNGYLVSFVFVKRRDLTILQAFRYQSTAGSKINPVSWIHPLLKCLHHRYSQLPGSEWAVDRDLWSPPRHSLTLPRLLLQLQSTRKQITVLLYMDFQSALLMSIIPQQTRMDTSTDGTRSWTSLALLTLIESLGLWFVQSPSGTLLLTRMDTRWAMFCNVMLDCLIGVVYSTDGTITPTNPAL